MAVGIWVRDRKVRTKILACLALVAAVALAVGGIAMTQLKAMNVAAQKINTDALGSIDSSTPSVSIFDRSGSTPSTTCSPPTPQ